jgi:hypothetical protein
VTGTLVFEIGDDTDPSAAMLVIAAIVGMLRDRGWDCDDLEAEIRTPGDEYRPRRGGSQMGTG